LEDKQILPYKKERNLLSYVNKDSGKIEYIDLDTGLKLEMYKELSFNDLSNELIDAIMQGITEGKSLQDVAREYSFAIPTFYAWISIYPEIKERYNKARENRADHHFFRSIDLAEKAIVAPKEEIPGIKIALETHKWAAERLNPSSYGSKSQVETTGSGSVIINLNTGISENLKHPDVVVDQFGNFSGFSEDSIATSEEKSDTVEAEFKELNRDRFKEHVNE